MPNTSKPKAPGAFLAMVGAACCAIAVPFVTAKEGTVYRGYLDIVKVPTKCSGDTNNVVVGRIYTKAECDESTDRQLAAHAEPVLRCTPGLRNHPEQLSAAISLAYNIGGNAYCGSTVARRFNARDWSGACDAFLAWNKAGGKVVAGLANRRSDERALCLRNLPRKDAS